MMLAVLLRMGSMVVAFPSYIQDCDVDDDEIVFVIKLARWSVVAMQLRTFSV